MKNIRKKSIYFYKQSFRDLAQLIIKSVFKNDIFFFLCFANKFCYADLLSPIHTESESTVALNTIFLLRTNGRSPKKPTLSQIRKLCRKIENKKKCLSLFLGSDLFFRCCLFLAKQKWPPAVEEAMRAYSKAEILLKCQVLVSISLHNIENYKSQFTFLHIQESLKYYVSVLKHRQRGNIFIQLIKI